MRGDAGDLGGTAADSPGLCPEPAVRREWRGLEKREKDSFIEAVRCLFEKRSLFPDRGSMYDDIVFVHQISGQAGQCNQGFQLMTRIADRFLAHKHPSFLPWHRWFIHQFERTLREECGYDGYLPYVEFPSHIRGKNN